MNDWSTLKIAVLQTPIQIIIHLPTTGNYPISIFVGSCKVDNFFSAAVTGIYSDDYRYYIFGRSGTNHKFKSTEVAFTVGGRIQNKFQWTAKMKNYDIEVFIYLFICILS